MLFLEMISFMNTNLKIYTQNDKTFGKPMAMFQCLHLNLSKW